MAAGDVEKHDPDSSVIAWLLDSDPSIRWQVKRDLLHEPDERVAGERGRVAVEGWGACLLAMQSPEGHWWAELDPWPWKNTLFTVVMLKDFGLDPACEEARRAIGRVRERIRWTYHDDNPFFEGESQACINGRILAVGSYFGEDVDRLAGRLLDEQLADGGWTCQEPPLTSSFNTTICVLEGLWAYEKSRGGDATVRDARSRAHEFLMDRGMFRPGPGGRGIEPGCTQFSYPPTYHYDILRDLDYLRDAGVEPDERIADAVALVAKKRRPNGIWPLENPHPDRIPFDMEGEAGTDSRWNTLRALRVLNWYSAESGQK